MEACCARWRNIINDVGIKELVTIYSHASSTMPRYFLAADRTSAVSKVFSDILTLLIWSIVEHNDMTLTIQRDRDG